MATHREVHSPRDRRRSLPRLGSFLAVILDLSSLKLRQFPNLSTSPPDLSPCPPLRFPPLNTNFTFALRYFSPSASSTSFSCAPPHPSPSSQLSFTYAAGPQLFVSRPYVKTSMSRLAPRRTRSHSFPISQQRGAAGLSAARHAVRSVKDLLLHPLPLRRPPPLRKLILSLLVYPRHRIRLIFHDHHLHHACICTLGNDETNLPLPSLPTSNVNPRLIDQ
ncbi:hypothetical protein R3P38DRAFT_3188949 [Favolaschia claudopus]|uniref:Uncharacterized protein n=1 Tax=Favolaschia claudopus TaxID=2862362 RepID=A0AAW0BTB8_9AGAR